MAELLSPDTLGQNSDKGGMSGRTRTLPKGRVSECPKPPRRRSQGKADSGRSVDLTAHAERLRPADSKRLKELATWYNEKPLPLCVKLESNGGRKWKSSHPGDAAEEIAGRLRTHAAFGSMSQDFIDTLMGELMTIWDANGGISEKSYNAALAVLEAAAPQNELEAMLVVQMIAANEAGLRCTSMVGKCGTKEHSVAFGNLSNKYMRTFVAQMEALTKIRRGGEQVVKYIHVHEGGQAVVAGTINQQGGRANAGSAEQPHGQSADSPLTALPCEDTTRHGVPVPGNAKREMSHTWREEPGSSEGQ